MNHTIEGSIRLAFSNRIEVITLNLIDATVLAERYIQKGCRRYPERLYLTNEEHESPTPELEQARVKVEIARVACDVAIMILLAVPVHNSGKAIALAKAAKHLPKRIRVAIDWMIALRTLLADATKKADIGGRCVSRKCRERNSKLVLDVCSKGLDVVDDGCFAGMRNV